MTITAPTARRVTVALGLLFAVVASVLALPAPAHAATTWFDVNWPSSSVVVGTRTSAVIIPAEQYQGDEDYVLERESDDGWDTVATVKATFATSGTVALPTDTLGAETFRVVYDGQETSAPFTLTVTKPAPRKVKTSLRVSVSTHAVKIGKRVALRGHVSGGSRVLLIQQHTLNGRWRTVGRIHSARTGRISTPLPKHLTGYFGVRALRVVAPTSSRFASSSKPVGRVRVAPYYRPQGSSKAFKLLGYRWNPCAGAIPVWVNLGGVPQRLGLVKETLGRIARASGLRFVIKGRTAAIPHLRGKIPAHGLLIAFASGARYPALHMNSGRPGDRRAIGLGGPRAVVGHQILSATVLIDTAWNYHGRLLQTLMHETGHAVGLDHPSTFGTQIMSAVATSAIGSNYGAGDLAGLERVGADAGCL
ncbi:hypothetical protein [Nocardioides sp. KR10-350]|uniref:hypothetical protein n=1 Tax=Nocardioides cheoyonin TaxID=3156615 RepID=UPI0032B539EE